MKIPTALPKWASYVAWAVALGVGLSSLGLSVPVFDLQSRTHARETFATKSEVQQLQTTLRDVRDNVIRLLERQGVSPIRPGDR